MCQKETDVPMFLLLSQNKNFLDGQTKWDNGPFLFLFFIYLTEGHWTLILLLQNELYLQLDGPLSHFGSADRRTDRHGNI